jgi:voltage-gated potassium channel
MFFRFSFHFCQTLWHFKSLFFGLFALVVGGAFLIAHLEQLPFSHALYFSFITGLTVGYGDIAPITPFGRLTSVLLAVVGILFTGMVVAVAVRASQQAWKDVHGSD